MNEEQETLETLMSHLTHLAHQEMKQTIYNMGKADVWRAGGDIWESVASSVVVGVLPLIEVATRRDMRKVFNVAAGVGSGN